MYIISETTFQKIDYKMCIMVLKSRLQLISV